MWCKFASSDLHLSICGSQGRLTRLVSRHLHVQTTDVGIIGSSIFVPLFFQVVSYYFCEHYLSAFIKISSSLLLSLEGDIKLVKCAGNCVDSSGGVIFNITLMK